MYTPNRVDEFTIRQREGMPYGGMPAEALLYKLEETDETGMPDYDLFEDESKHKDYARGVIIDRSPDEPYFESDHAIRDPALAKSRLNLTYNGTRSNQQELPRHPELFYGFTGNDPRGSDTSQPRMDALRRFTEAKAGEISVRFGKNDDNTEAQRPWTAQSISYAKKELLRRTRDLTKIFTPSMTNFVPGIQLDPSHISSRRTRNAAMGNGTDDAAWNGWEQKELMSNGGYVDHAGQNIRHLPKNTWRYMLQDTDFSPNIYGIIPSASKQKSKSLRHGADAIDNDFAEHMLVPGTNNNTLGDKLVLKARQTLVEMTQDPEEEYDEGTNKSIKTKSDRLKNSSHSTVDIMHGDEEDQETMSRQAGALRTKQELVRLGKKTMEKQISSASSDELTVESYKGYTPVRDNKVKKQKDLDNTTWSHNIMTKIKKTLQVDETPKFRGKDVAYDQALKHNVEDRFSRSKVVPSQKGKRIDMNREGMDDM